MTQPPKAIVTGGAGFIGSHLVDALLAKGVWVIALDSLMTGRRKNIEAALSHPRFSFVQADVCDTDSLIGLFEGVDWVFHLAALADIVPSIQKPQLYFQNNVTGSLSVMEAARQTGVRKVIYAASSSCYGVPDVYPTPESAPIRPEYPYALTKYLGEQIVLHWGKVYDVPVLSLRLFNVYGPRSRTTGAYGAVFGVFLSQLLHGQPLTIVGDGAQSRDFTFVSDVAEAFAAAAASVHRGDVFNVGSGGHYSVNLLVDLLGAKARVHIPKRPGEPDCTFADTTKICNMIGWKPKVSFEAGVQLMLKQLEDWRDAPVWTPESIAKATQDWFTYLSPRGVTTA